MGRITLALILFALLFTATDEAQARRTIVRTRTVSVTARQAIRSTPILLRPSRPGHFYGNTVRRRYYRSH